MSQKSFTTCVTVATLMVTLVWSTTLVADTGTGTSTSTTDTSTSAHATATTITSNATTAATTAATTPSTTTDSTGTGTSTDLTRNQFLNALLAYDSSLIIQNAAVQPPGDPPPSADPSQPPPPYASIPAIETDVNNTLASQTLDEDLFYLYGVSFVEPAELASVPLKTGYLSKHFSAYCSPKSTDETTAYVCNNKADSPLQHADLKPVTLLGPLRYDGPGGIAALEYIRSAIDPWAEKNIQSLLSNASDSGNQDKIAKALSRQSKLNAPVYSMLSAYARRLPSATNPNNKTFMETLEFETEQRYPNVAWHQNIATAPQEALLKDIAAMMALSLWIQKEQFKQNERLELLMGMNVIGSIRMQDKYQESQEQGSQAAASASSTAASQTSTSSAGQ